MSLSIPAVPQEAVTALAAALPKLVTSPAVAARLPRAAVGVARFMTARTAISLPFYVLDLSDVRKGVMAARQVGWRHLLPTGDPAGPALAETAIRNSNQHVFAGVTESPFASDLENRLTVLRADPTVSAGSYVAALLQVPAMDVMAIWLQDTAHHDDLIVPLAPAPPSLTAGRQYSTSQFLDALRASG
ncbi:MAG: hypothetical protein ACLP4V_09690 [Methylocella sp.]